MKPEGNLKGEVWIKTKMMDKVKVLKTVIILALLLSLTACESVDMTDEQHQKIVSYAADVVMSHNANSGTLKKLTPNKLAEIVEPEIPVIEPETPEEPDEAEEEAISSSDLPPSSHKGGEETEAKDALVSDSIAESLGLGDFDISYRGCELADAYPSSSGEEDGSGILFSIEPASPEDLLLVMHFTITNISDHPAECDFLSLSPVFRINLNGNRMSVLKTLLLDDMGTLEASLEPSGSVDAVLVSEVGRSLSEPVDSLDLLIGSAEGYITVPLE